jgi:hypothetical protein
MNDILLALHYTMELWILLAVMLTALVIESIITA